MALSGKVESEIEIQAPAAMFYSMFSKKPHQVPQVTDHVQGAKIHEGDWENVGSVAQWDFTIEGKKASCKEKVEAIDDDNKTITYSLFDGEISEGYKSFKAKLQVIDKENGAIVKWSMEYVKLKENITASSPHSFMDFATKVTKDIDAHLVNNLMTN